MSNIDRIVEGQLLDESVRLNLEEICEQLRVEQAWIVDLVDAGVLEPRGSAPEAWVFAGTAVSRACVTARLMDDLEVNLAGVALILDLLDERRRLERRLQQFEKLLDD
jgi:chaperone modulatory protein CbpM